MVVRLARLAVLIGAALAPLPAVAQHWMTRERCTVTEIAVDADALSGETLRRLRTESADVPNGVGNYWRITAPGGGVSHLWGTWHSNDPQMLVLPEPVERHVRNARVAAFELDMIAATRRAAENAASPRDFWAYRRGTLARLDLPRDIERWINARLISTGWGDGVADLLSPGGLAELVLADPCNDFAAGVYPIQDDYLQTLAAIEGARILGLERRSAFREKLNKTRNLELARDLLVLYGVTLSPTGTAAERATAFALYQQGEHAVSRLWERETLASQLGAKRGAEVQDSVDSYLLDERNAGFVEALIPELDRGEVFIGVGAWHLQGSQGLVSLLRQAGYRVTRIPLDRENVNR